MQVSLNNSIKGLESLFSIFNERYYNNELEKPIISISPDSTSGAYGWCTSGRVWNNVSNENSTDMVTGYYEINMCSEYLNRSLEEISETLLHEMAHLYNVQNGITDTSRNGYYHNKNFKKCAEKHGLIVYCCDKYGYCDTKLNNEAKTFVSTLSGYNFDVFRIKADKSSKPKQSTRKLVCPSCGNIIRVTKMNINVICGDCLVSFQEMR